MADLKVSHPQATRQSALVPRLAKHITERAVKAARPPSKGSRIHYDDVLRGFGLRVTASGVKAFILNYSVAGRERRCTIGRHPAWSAEAARNEAMEIRVKLDKLNRGEDGGADPLQERDQARNAALVSELAEDYMQRYAVPRKRPKSVHEDRLMLNRIVLPKLGRLRVSAVGRRDVEALHTSLRTTPVQANRVLALVSKVFSWAMDSGLRADNPARGVKRFHEERRESWLSREQLQALATALDEYPDQNATDALRLLIVTGSRPQEVLTAEWPMFDLARAVWTKPSHHTKQKKVEHVPLSAAAMGILTQMAESRKDGDVHLFPGKQDGRARTTLKNAWKQVCRAAGLATMRQVMGKRGKMLERWRPNVRVYDLRHSFASHLVSRGASLYLVGRLLGHTQPSTTTRYAHVADQALRDIANGFPDVLGDPKKPPASEKPARVPTLLAGD
jgi:integrase